MKAKIIGFFVNESKKGNIGTTIYLETAYTDYRKENALVCVGNECFKEYIRGDYSKLLELGQEVSLVYGKGYEGKAVLQEVVPINGK